MKRRDSYVSPLHVPRGSPLTFPSCPNIHPPETINVAEYGLHPSLEGRGQVNLGVEGPKKKKEFNTHIV